MDRVRQTYGQTGLRQDLWQDIPESTNQPHAGPKTEGSKNGQKGRDLILDLQQMEDRGTVTDTDRPMHKKTLCNFHGRWRGQEEGQMGE